MKKNQLKNSIIAGVLCTALTVPMFAQADNVQPVAIEEGIIAPINYRLSHWSEKYIDQLSREYDAGALFEGKDPEAVIEIEDFDYLVRHIIDENYNNMPDSLAREAVVHELIKIWAEKTGIDLKDIAVIEMIIYSDTHEIDSKYNRSVTLAYMKNIAIGKGSGIFDPKAYVTYGELAALICNTDKAIKEEIKSDEQNIMKDKFETRGSYEIKDDKVIFNFELVSHHTETKQLKFGSGQQFEITITDENGEEVYRYSDDKFFTMALLYKDINPGESIRWQDEWDMTNKEGDKLTSGKYSAKISIMAIVEEGDEKIDESQLTTVIDFTIGSTDEKGSRQEKSQTEYELTEEGIIKPELAEEIIKEITKKVINAISTKDSKTISEFVHPVKGVRFTPYTYVSLEDDVVFSKEEMENFFENQNVYQWGYYDGIGEKISLTPGEYYEKFIYSEDFINAEEIGYNEVLSSGNMIENQFKVYENAIVVEYYFPGFNPDYDGMDWKSLRLVFEEYEDGWKLTGIIHNQWTI
jgi:hypothetical protein